MRAAADQHLDLEPARRRVQLAQVLGHKGDGGQPAGPLHHNAVALGMHPEVVMPRLCSTRTGLKMCSRLGRWNSFRKGRSTNE